MILDKPEQIASFRIAVLVQYARGRARGLHLTSVTKAPKIRDINKQYNINARTWAQVVEQLKEKYSDG